MKKALRCLFFAPGVIGFDTKSYRRSFFLPKKIHLLFFFLLAAGSGLYGQYTETFPIANKGYLNNTPSTPFPFDDFNGVDWTMTPWPVSTSNPNLFLGRDPDNYFKTIGGALEAIDLDVEVCWVSPELFISGTASFSVDLSWIGFDNDTGSGSDYIHVEYTTNNGTSWTPVPNLVGGGSKTIEYINSPGPTTETSTTVGVSNISGTNLQIRICVDNSSSTEVVKISNISATNADDMIAPLVCDLAFGPITVSNEDCPGANDGSLTVTTTTSNGPVTYSISGPVSQTNTTGVFTGLPDGDYTITADDNSFAIGDCQVMTTRTINAGVDGTAPTASNPASINVPCIDAVPLPDPAVVIDEDDNCTVDCTTEPWINEFHYDNTGGDVNEFIEIAGPAGLDLSAYTIYTYDGFDFMVDQTFALSGIIDDEQNGFGALSFTLPSPLQNGIEGIALVRNTGSVVIEFLSYEGGFVAANGPASGMASTDVGVSESDSQATTESIARTGTGNTGTEFTFVDQGATAGSLNTNQTIVPCPEKLPVVTFNEDVNNGNSITRSYRVTDAAGNVIFVSQTINITGGIDPVITNITTNQEVYCPMEPITITIDGNLNDAVEWVVYNGDGCGVTDVISSADASINIGSRTTPGLYTIYVRGEGPCTGNVACFELTIDVTGADYDLTCNSPSPALVGPTCVNALPDYTSSGFVSINSGGCTGATVTTTQYPAPGTLQGPGEYPIIMTVTDDYGNSGSCVITLTVNDELDPTANTLTDIEDIECMENVPAPDPELVLNEMDNCEDCPETVWVNEFHYDNAGVDVNEFVEVAGTAGTDLSSYSLYFYDGTTGTVYATVPLTGGTIDEELNGFGAITFPITGIQDEEPDGFALVKDGTQVLEFWSYDGFFVAADGPAMGMQSTDVGFSEIASAEGNSLQRIGTGNIGPDFAWTGPTTASPGDLNAGQTITTCATVSVAFDSDVPDMGTGLKDDPKTIVRTYLVSDGNGNELAVTQNIVVEDVTPPMISCPANIAVNNDPDQCSAVVSYSVPVGTDNCTGMGTSTSQTDGSGYTSGDAFPVGMTTQTFQVTDASGLTGECSFTVTVTDNEPPKITCQDVTIQLDASGNKVFNIFADGPALVTQSDNCGLQGGASRTGPGNFTCAEVGKFPITIFKNDVNGNQASCQITLTIADTDFPCNQPPMAVCQNITVFTDAGCQATITPEQVNNGSSDLDGDMLMFSLDDSGPFAVGMHTVTLTVSDGSLSDECMATITVEDNTPPTALCQNVTVQLDAMGNGSLTEGAVNNGSNDACGIANLSLDETDFSCSDVGGNTVTLTVTDNNGNSSTCTATVTVEDNVPPTALCQNVTVQLDASGNGSTTEGAVNNGSNDACGIANLSLDETDFSCSDVGGNTVTLTVTDNNGNSSTCTATVTVEDNVPPTALCQNVTVQLDASGNGSTTEGAVNNGSNDACGIANLSLDETDFSCSDVGGNTVTLTVTDNNGNSSTCTATVTVEDNIAPEALCVTGPIAVQLDATGNATLLPETIDNGSFDNCTITDRTVSPNQFDCTDVGGGPITVTLFVTDGINTDDCTTTVTVLGIVTIDDIVVTDESCDGAGDGKIEIMASGENTLEYSIDGGATFQSEPLFTSLDDGDYNIVVRDDVYTDCQETASESIAAGPVCELTAADPCNCLNNASPYDMDTETGGGDGQFSEVVTISADEPLPAGLIFKVIAPTTGVYDVYNVPAEGDQSDGVAVATDGSVTFTYNNGVYELPFVHHDGEGYTMTVILEVEGVNSIGFQLSNTCFYPEPEITSVLDGPFCSLSLPVTLEGNAGGVDGTGTFYIDGTEITIFDPAAYEPGIYTISYEFDAGEALGYQLENGLVVGPPEGAETLEDAEADPGCIATVIKSVEIIPKPEGYACSQQVNVNLQGDCQATLTPESVLGDLACVDLSGLFEIVVADDDPSNGPIVDGCGTYNYSITGPDGVDCWGVVLAQDKQAPVCYDWEGFPSEVDGWSTYEYGWQEFVCTDIDKLLLDGEASYRLQADGSLIEGSISSKHARWMFKHVTGYAKFTDNCGEITVTVTDVVDYGYDPNCDDVVITRTFRAVDACGDPVLTAECSQKIIITKPDLDDVVCPKDVELACDDDFKLDANGNPHPDETGYPWLYQAFDVDYVKGEDKWWEYEHKAYLNPTFCNLGASYTDGERIEVCAGTYKIVRTWEILDWCRDGYERIRECTQVIKVGDEEPPTVVCEEVDYDNDGESDLRSYSTGPYDCTAAFSVPMPEVTDNCSEWEVLTEILEGSKNGPVVATILPGASRYVSGIPIGCHFIRYTVTDGCDKRTVVYCPFVVEDRVEPVAVCDDDLNVSIGGQGLARVYADDIDEGSSDNCGPIRIEVRRRILDPENYECLDMFDADGDGEIIGDEIQESPQFGDPDGDGVGQMFYYTPWGDYVDFTCCDMNQNVRVELRVWDDRNGDGKPGNTIEKTYCSEYGAVDVRDNFNVCWMDLLIEDKLPAYCVSPLPAYINCDELPFDFDPTNSEQMAELFGEATGSDNCPGYTITELDPLTDGLNDCGYGTFVRRFSVADDKGQASTNKCEQVVTIKEQHKYKIKFPKDAEANCGTPQVDTIETEELACDLLAVSVKDDFFSASGDECYKIFRTYSVINWCEYDGESDPVVVSRDEDCDGKPGDEDVWVIVMTMDDKDPCYDYYGGYQEKFYSHVWYDRDSDPFNLVPKAGTKGEQCDYETNPYGFWKEVTPITENEDKDTDNYPKGYYGEHCDDMASVGYWQYTQVIKVYDNVNPIVEFADLDPFCSYSSDFDADCPAEVSIDFTIDENCTPDDLTIAIYLDAFADGILDGDITDQLSGTYPNYTITGSFPLGAHAIGVSVKDGCGNEVGVNIPFEVVDCKAPSPICINGLAIELMPVFPAADADGDGDLDNGAMAIWASDFIASPVPDCTGEVKYSINRVGEEVDADQTGITLTCDDDASLLVEIWAWDGIGNGDFCETYVLVQDNMVNCTDGNTGGSIAGIITNEDLNTVSGVDVALSGSAFQNMVTPNDGHYQFMELGYNFDYTVTPHLDQAPLNGVSTFDLVLMSKHILGTQLLDSPYKMIAADVNNSKTITTLDAIQLRRLVLNIDLKFSNNNSWRFVPRAYQFPDSAKPWSPAFPEVININNLQGALNQEDFVAIKIGDLNLSAATNALVSVPRTISGEFFFTVADQQLNAGETYQVEFRAKDLAKIQGYQMTLQLDPDVAKITDLNYGIAKAANFGMREVEQGLISTSWNVSGDGAVAYDVNEVIFSLSLKARADAKLSDILSLSNRITVAEAYDLDDQLLDVGIDFGTTTVAAAGFELYQNVPNPFREGTQIGFYLPEASEVSLRIYDISGRTIKLIRGEFARGHNQVSLTKAELGAAGMLYYTLTAGEYTASRKMMVME